MLLEGLHVTNHSKEAEIRKTVRTLIISDPAQGGYELWHVDLAGLFPKAFCVDNLFLSRGFLCSSGQRNSLVCYSSVIIVFIIVYCGH